MPHLALLGDSIFDNGVYVDCGPDVKELVGEILPPGRTVSLQAIDGSTAPDVPEQLQQPSVIGGRKIAAALVASLGLPDSRKP